MKCLRCYGQPDKEAKFISCLTKMRVCDADDEEDSKIIGVPPTQTRSGRIVKKPEVYSYAMTTLHNKASDDKILLITDDDKCKNYKASIGTENDGEFCESDENVNKRANIQDVEAIGSIPVIQLEL